MKVTLPDGNVLELAVGATGADAAAAIGPGLAKAALALKQRGELQDLHRELIDGAELEIITERSGQVALDLLRHDTAHVLAAAALELYPGVKIAIGPAIENGFYYDFEFPEGTNFSDADFPALEAQMQLHITADESFLRETVTVADAIDRFQTQGQPYKTELIRDLVKSHGVDTVTLYTNGPFTDLCRGPHGPGTKRIGAYKLQSTAGAYWRGDPGRGQLTRVYGTSFFRKKDLREHLDRLEQARARDHRKLGRELGLFRFSDTAQGAAFWLPHGTTVFNSLIGVSRAMCASHGYTEVKTPQLYDASLWETSGHWFKYRQAMFTTQAEEQHLALKPMNCPGHSQLFKMQKWSHRDLPVRYCEPGLLHRNELSGALHGLLRARHFVQDDAHVFCTPDQALSETKACLDMAFETYALFGITPRLELSTRPDERIGAESMWDAGEELLTQALDEKGLEWTLNPGDGAFYGPKIDLHFEDSLARSWQLGTVQIDFNLPERFELTYTGPDNAEHRVVMLHRALFGSYERFIAILLEDTAGDLPMWLAPVQARVLPISDRHNANAQAIVNQLTRAGLRAEADTRTESAGRKIRDAELAKIPFMLIVGDRETADHMVSVRRRGVGDEGPMSVTEVAALLTRLMVVPVS